MDYFPIFTKIKDRHCLVVGGGDIAVRKVHLLLKAGAAITVCAPEVCESLQQKADNNQLIIIHDVLVSYFYFMRFVLIFFCTCLTSFVKLNQ